MTWGVLALASLATYRLTRLVTTDELTEGLRLWVLRRWPARTEPIRDAPTGLPVPDTSQLVPRLPVRFVHCSWCVSVWVALAVLLAVHFAGLLASWQMLGLAWMAVATLAGLLSRLGG